MALDASIRAVGTFVSRYRIDSLEIVTAKQERTL